MLDTSAKEWLTQRFAGHLRFDEPLRLHTTLRVGGPADAYVVVEDVSALREFVVWAAGHGIPYFAIGRGSNMVVQDAGARAVAVSLGAEFSRIECQGRREEQVMVRAGAGAPLSALCRFALDHALAGMNFAVGIPGSVGGALSMNAGAGGGCMADVVDSVRVMTPEGEILSLAHDQIRWSYRNACFPLSQRGTVHSGPILLECVLHLRRGDSVAIAREAQRILEARRESQPPMPNAGCFFKNPASGSPAGELIERAGLKGHRVGGAQISPVHANFIVNTGQATAEDVLALMEIVRQQVERSFGINLEPEVQILAV